MAVFVDLGEDIKPHQDAHLKQLTAATGHGGGGAIEEKQEREEAHESVVKGDRNQTSMAKALGCYPIVISVASHLDLNSLDSLSRTCRQIHYNLLQYRAILVVSTLHCSNEDLPVDPDDTLRFRARAGNWFYMEDAARTNYNGKSGQCARDMVSGCRRCGTVVCRNCAIKPPAPIVLRDRHRRLCTACVKAPIGDLVKPHLGPEVRIDSDDMERAMCQCGSEGVWLCQPCGRTIRGDDYDYKGIWRWRNQYTEVLGGLGTGIGDGDRGVICGRGAECCSSREREQETDCDAEDAREADQLATTPLSHASSNTSSSSSPFLSPSAAGVGSTASNSSTGLPGGALERRTPSPAIKVGYVRHEVEGIGGVMKKIVVKMVKVGACVPEWDDERLKGAILEREVSGNRRSWCGWCWRVIPSKKDYELDRHGPRLEAEGSNMDKKGKGKERAF